MLEDLNNFASGWTDWNIALDMKGGPNWANNVVDAPIILNTDDKNEYYKNPMFYYLGHFAKFIDPGSVRIHSVSSGLIPIETVSLRNPNKQVCFNLLVC